MSENGHPGHDPDRGELNDPIEGSDLFTFSRNAIREVDRLATERYGIPSIVLMENAARAVSDVALDLLDDGERVVICCGPGNNGGDGLAAARHLHNAGVDVAIVATRPLGSYEGDAGVNAAIVERMGIPLAPSINETGRPALIIDALLGTGVSRDVEGEIGDLIDRINQLGESGWPVVSVDIPSGLDCDTGEPHARAVSASVTVTFVGLKEGFLSLSAQSYLGELVVADIGAPVELCEELGDRVAWPPPDPHEGGAGEPAATDARPSGPGRTTDDG